MVLAITLVPFMRVVGQLFPDYWYVHFLWAFQSFAWAVYLEYPTSWQLRYAFGKDISGSLVLWEVVGLFCTMVIWVVLAATVFATFMMLVSPLMHNRRRTKAREPGFDEDSESI